jgi:DNA-directed RNA polymerase specialized sigma24 family protein
VSAPAPLSVKESVGGDTGWREELARLDRDIKRRRDRQRELVARVLAAGVTYAEVGRVLGVSRQYAHKRFSTAQAQDPAS